MDGFQVEIQDMNGVFRLPEAEELRMMDISFCLPLQNFACQEAFPPQGNQADSIQVRGVECPESHVFWTQKGCLLLF